MTIYEYKCEKCGTFETTQRITDKSLSRCPTCKGKVRKLISNTSFQLKGSGWYVTDYAGKNASGKAKDEGGDKKTESADASKESSDGAKAAKDSPTKEAPAKSTKSDGKK